MTKHLALFTLLALAACKPAHAEWQNQFVESHTEVIYMPVVTPGLNNTMTTTIQPQYYDECDRTKRVCVAGEDGSTDCGADKGE